MQRLKRWESPRRQGRNDKGKGGSARRRQIKKQYQMLRQKLKATSKGREVNLFLLFVSFFRDLSGEDVNSPEIIL